MPEIVIPDGVTRATVLQGWRRPKEDDRFHVTIELHLTDFRRKDIDNIAKSIFDGLKPVVVVDDWQVSSTYVTRITVERVAERVVRRSKRPHGPPGARSPHSIPPSEENATPSRRPAGRLRTPSGGGPS